MPRVTPIESNMPDIVGTRTTAAQSSVGGPFSSVYDAMSYGSAIAGPAAAESLAASGNLRGASIVGASVTAASGGAYAYPGGFSAGVGNYYGGIGPSALGRGVPPNPVGDDTVGQAQQVLAQSQSSSIAMLMLQNQMGQQTREYTTVSNLMNSRDTMLASIIRNVRVG